MLPAKLFSETQKSSLSLSPDKSFLSLPSGGVAITPPHTGPWSPPSLVFNQSPSMVPGAMMGAQPAGFSQPMVFTTSPAVAGWNQPSSFAASTPPPAPVVWGPSASVSPNTWSSASPLGNPFQSNIFPVPAVSTQSPSMLSSLLVTPPQPPPRTGPPKDISTNAFVALDPLGDKEVKEVKEMFKDLQLRQPPVPARKGDQTSSGTSSAFSSYFNSKVGIPQENADHDDFDANQLLKKINGKLPTSSSTMPTSTSISTSYGPTESIRRTLSHPPIA